MQIIMLTTYLNIRSVDVEIKAVFVSQLSCSRVKLWTRVFVR